MELFSSLPGSLTLLVVHQVTIKIPPFVYFGVLGVLKNER